MSDLAELRRVAEAATPGPWSLERSWDNYHGDEPGDEGGDWVGPHGAYSSNPKDNAFIATFDPPTILAMIARLEAQQDVVEAAKLPDGVGHHTQYGVHWYDPQSSPHLRCRLCVALARLEAGDE